ncbi:GNAT family N-acetyltransferase [Aquimarina sp. I32.4]|uniref:GNAT family N-acetyltransferase n=1 Tax=Aquimarina sp. I32.4 TaxID=2053903 RepID=UPI000CDEAEAE|nr:GNAT family N-acetyltransferase [Aquimarina sp. I32.4]
MNVELKEYTPLFFEALNSYRLDKKQSDFTASLEYCLYERKDLENPEKTLVVIVFEELPVGFFVFDQGNDKYKLTDNPKSILIRSLSINPKYQGKGIGKYAMQLTTQFIKDQIPQINEIVLSVNFKNKNAYYTYLKSGYIDDNKVIIGIKGEQHVLTKKI